MTFAGIISVSISSNKVLISYRYGNKYIGAYEMNELSSSISSHVTGIGGVFFKVEDTELNKNWYRDILGFPINDYGGAEFKFRENDFPETQGYSVFGIFASKTEYFNPSQKEFMINLRVRDLDGLLIKLEKLGINQVGERESYDYGDFAWIIDPNGIKLELWEQKYE